MELSMKASLRINSLVRVSLAGAVAMLAAGQAQAATITCPNAPSGTYLEVDYAIGTISCADWQGNPGGVTGWATPPDFPNAADGDLIYNGTTYALIGDTDAGSGLAGTLNLGAIGDYLVLFKFGGGRNNPDWFILFLDDASTAEWELKNGSNGLSHATVWGDPGVPQVPEPASLLLFGSGLLGAAAARRRASKKA
jgi:hypothetical protein